MVSERDFDNVTCAILCRHLCMFISSSRQSKNQSLGGEEICLLFRLVYVIFLKHFEDRKAWSVHIYYAWCDIILIVKQQRRTRFTPRSSIHGLKIRMTSHPCNKYEQITLSFLLLSVN